MRDENLGKNDFERGYIAGVTEMLAASSVTALLLARKLVPDFRKDREDYFLTIWTKACNETLSKMD